MCSLEGQLIFLTLFITDDGKEDIEYVDFSSRAPEPKIITGKRKQRLHHNLNILFGIMHSCASKPTRKGTNMIDKLLYESKVKKVKLGIST